VQFLQELFQRLQLGGAGFDQQLNFRAPLDPSLPVIERSERQQADADRQPRLKQCTSQTFGVGGVRFGGEHQLDRHG
jgi:hypothetical protein